MDEPSDFILNALAQFAGGPGPPENNLVRFGLAASVWGTLLVISWNRQRQQNLDREKLLVLGFGLALFRELFMLSHLSLRLISGQGHDISCSVVAPIEHGLTLASVIVISGAFMRYILDDAALAKRYLQIGLSVSAVALVIAFLVWPAQLAADSVVRFHQTWSASLLHLVAVAMIATAIAVLVSHRGWLRNVVIMALALLFLSELAVLVNFVTGHQLSQVLCPIGNSIYLLAIPLFGLVYFREQAEEKRQTDRALDLYREHLEDLVRDRTAEIAQRNAELAAQNAIAATISQSLDLEAVLESVLEKTVSLFRMSFGCFLLADEESGRLAVHATRLCDSFECAFDQREMLDVWRDIAEKSERQLQPVFESLDVYGQTCGVADSADICWHVVGVPIMSEGRATGALILGSRDSAEPGIVQSDLLIAIGQQIGVAVEKAQLVEQLGKTAVLQERQRIAAEVHDGLAQTLSYLGLRTDDARDLLADLDAPSLVQVLADIRSSVLQATHEVRQSIASLQSDPVPAQDLQAALTKAMNREGFGGDPSLVLLNDLVESVEMEHDVLDQVLHVVQEAITNAQRHANAHEIRVHLSQAEDSLQVRVEDDGQGFDPADIAAAGGDHFGLNLMQVRAARIHGRLVIDSFPRRGTCITLTWPK